MVSTDKLIKVGVRYSDKYFETLKNIYNNDSTLLQEILLEAKTGVMGILCNSNRIYNKINSMKTTT